MCNYYSSVINLPARMQSLCLARCVRRLWAPAQTNLLLKLGNMQKYVNCWLHHRKVMCILILNKLEMGLLKTIILVNQFLNILTVRV